MNPVIKDFLEKGYINKEAAMRLQEFEGQVKEADWKETFADLGKTLLKQVPVFMAAYAGNKAADYLGQRELNKEQGYIDQQVQSSFDQLMAQNPVFQKNRDLASQRFNEITKLSPTVASSPFVAGKLVQKKLKTGLDIEDMSKLMAIENNARKLKRVDIPETALGSGLKAALPTIGQELSRGIDQYMTASENMPTISTPYEHREVFNILKENNKLPSEFQSMSFDETNGPRWITFLTGNPDFISKALSSNNLVGEAKSRIASLPANQKSSGQEKVGSVLARQYLIFRASGLNKTASGLNWWQRALAGLGMAAVAGGAAGLAQEGADYARTKAINKKIEGSWDSTSKNLQKMTGAGSTFSSGINYADKDTQEKAKNTFQVLAEVAPNLATNPTIATSFVNTVMQNEGIVTPDFVKMLSETQKNMASAREYKSPFAGSPMSQGFGAGFGAAGGEDIIKNVAKVVVSGKKGED